MGADRSNLPHIEPYLAIDPGDPSKLVAATMVAGPTGLEVHLLVSSNGGNSWVRAPLPKCAFDPWVSFAKDRTAYVSCLVGKEAWIFRSLDQGSTWEDPVVLPRAGGGEFDHTSLAVAPDCAAETCRLWVVGLQPVDLEGHEMVSPFVSRSDDRGASFSEPSRLVWSWVWSNTLNAVADSDGGLTLAFVDYYSNGRLLEQPRVWVTRTDDGERFAPLSLAAVIRQSSTIPVIAEGSGRMHIAFDDVRDGTTGVFLTSSTDSGRTWSRPHLVSGHQGEKSHYNAQVAAGPSDEVAVAWYEEHPRGSRCFHFVVAASSDGGAEFDEPIRLTEEPACVDSPGNVVGGEGGGSVARRWPFGGDYFGMTPWGTGRFALLWADSRSGSFQLRLAELTARPAP